MTNNSLHHIAREGALHMALSCDEMEIKMLKVDKRGPS